MLVGPHGQPWGFRHVVTFSEVDHGFVAFFTGTGVPRPRALR